VDDLQDLSAKSFFPASDFDVEGSSIAGIWINGEYGIMITDFPEADRLQIVFAKSHAVSRIQKRKS
jgi:hypothetical protein